MPDMQVLQKELGSKILVLAVGMGEEAERIEKFQKKHQFEFQILPDPEMTVTQLYGVRNIPITYMVNTSGIVVGRALGPREWTRPKLLEFLKISLQNNPIPSFSLLRLKTSMPFVKPNCSSVLCTALIF